MKHIAINGFGRIGRLALRTALLNHNDADIKAVNTSGSMDMNGWYQLFKYDTVYGIFEKQVSFKDGENENEIGRLVVDDNEIPFLANRNPEEIPWSDYDVEVVLESTGAFLTKEKAEKHLNGSVKRVIMSAPPKDDTPMIMLKVNQDSAEGHSIISNCSCTTYSTATVVQTIHDAFTIQKASLTTVHAYTSDQNLLDGSHKKDVRRARAAAVNMIPTSSGAAKAVTAVIPELKGKFEARAIRVPVTTGSLSELTFLLEKQTSVEEINETLKNAANGVYKGILGTTSDPIVSSDIVGTSESAIVDLSLTTVVDGNLATVFAWYDNEWSYACRLVELASAV